MPTVSTQDISFVPPPLSLMFLTKILQIFVSSFVTSWEPSFGEKDHHQFGITPTFQVTGSARGG